MDKENYVSKDLTISQRQDELVSLLIRHGNLSYSQLSDYLGVSEMTIRRDAAALEKKQMIQKIKTGEIGLKDKYVVDPGYSKRQTDNLGAKMTMAVEGKQLISDGMVIGMDGSTSSLELAKVMNGFKDMTVVTSSLLIPTLLTNSGIKVIVSGGHMREESLSLVGKVTNDRLENYNYHYSFCSIDAIDIERGLTDTNEEEVNVKLALMKNAHTKVLLADSSKFNRWSFCHCCDISYLDILITDNGIDKKTKKGFEDAGVRVIVAKT